MQAFLFIYTKALFMTYPHAYGVCNHDNVHTDTSMTERGAKNYATRRGYRKVSIRFNCGYHVQIIATKNEKGRWIKAD